MSTIPVELPDHLKSYVDQSAERAGYANASECIVALVTAASEKQREIEQALKAGMRTKLVKDFPNHVVFYIEIEG